jgi:hypothetical protein
MQRCNRVQQKAAYKSNFAVLTSQSFTVASTVEQFLDAKLRNSVKRNANDLSSAHV